MSRKPDPLEALRAAVERSPTDARRRERYAAALRIAGQLVPALRQLDRVIELGAATATTWKDVGVMLVQVGEYAQALGAFEQAFEGGAEDAETYHEAGRAHYRLGEVSRAAERLERACVCTDAIDPWLALATLAPGNPAYRAADIRRIRESFAERLARLEPAANAAGRALRPSPATSGRLRVGYVSSWFDRENYMKPVWSVIDRHDRSAFEIHLFSDTPPSGPQARPFPGCRLDPGDRLHVTADQDNYELAEVIGRAGIDLLVDLNSYSTPWRLGLFLQRPAPVVAAWFNLYATAGLAGLDAVIGDEVVAPVEDDVDFREQVIRLPQSYLSFTVTHEVPPIVDPPWLSRGTITFGSLVSQYKLTEPVIDAWAEILRRVPDARLLLGNTALDSPSNRDHLAARFARRGIERERLEFRGRADHLRFLHYYDEIDVALDAFPYNGGTTTTEAIWQGVPVIAFRGDRWAARTSASLLQGTHLEPFVADNVAGYVNLAVRWGGAGCRQELKSLRHSMRRRLRAAPVCDAAGLTAALENAYRDLVASGVDSRRSSGPPHS